MIIRHSLRKRGRIERTRRRPAGFRRSRSCPGPKGRTRRPGTTFFKKFADAFTSSLRVVQGLYLRGPWLKKVTWYSGALRPTTSAGQFPSAALRSSEMATSMHPNGEGRMLPEVFSSTKRSQVGTTPLSWRRSGVESRAEIHPARSSRLCRPHVRVRGVVSRVSVRKSRGCARPQSPSPRPNGAALALHLPRFLLSTRAPSAGLARPTNHYPSLVSSLSSPLASSARIWPLYAPRPPARASACGDGTASALPADDPGEALRLC